MKFSVMFWNVERYRGGGEQMALLHEDITAADPDILCLCGITDKGSLRHLIREQLHGYDISVTDDYGRVELATAWRRGKFDQVIFTQRREFGSDESQLRPGSLVSVLVDGTEYHTLFLYTDGGTSYRDYQDRLDTYDKVWDLKTSLDEISSAPDGARLLVMGDMETVGKRRQGRYPAVESETEIEDLADQARSVGMRMLSKTHDATTIEVPGGDRPPVLMNLDHALATPNISFGILGGQTGVRSAEVRVSGWTRLDDRTRDTYVDSISKHAPIYCEIE
jgi:hypothetical protein